MNKVILLGRLTKDPDVRYTQSENMLAIARYTLAVDRRFKKEGQPSADFINCVAFGKSAEFAEKYMTKGRLFGVIGKIQTRNYENDKKEKVYVTEVVVEEQYFADSKKDDKKDINELLKTDDDKLKELETLDLELYIQNYDKQMFFPIVKDEIIWETFRKDSPSKLTFTVVKDNNGLSFNEGSLVIFRYKQKDIFKGFVFEKSRDSEHHIKVVAYDQMRYLKNKHTYIYENKTASELVKMIASDFGLVTGEIQDTGYKISSRIEDNNALIDMIQFAISETYLNTGKLFTLYDDAGKLSLVDLNTLKINDIAITGDSTQNFDYKTTIDSDVYNRVVLYQDDEEKNRHFYAKQDDFNVGRWGILQLTEKLNEGENPTNKVKIMLDLYNRTNRAFTIKDTVGDIRLRAGATVYCKFDLGDLILEKLMVVEHATHKFSNSQYFADLLVIGFLY